MDIFKHFRKCFLCGQSRNGLEKVSYKVYHGNHTYSTVYFAYHPTCLKFVLCEPEKYSHEKVGKALRIATLIKEYKKEKKEKILITKKERQECIEKAKELCNSF
jgi:predicted GIY-YIG superfamily endonuclease